MGAFFLLRISDHMQYLRKITAALEGHGDFRGFGSDSHECKLGRWIDGAGRQESAGYGPVAVRLFPWFELDDLVSGKP